MKKIFQTNNSDLRGKSSYYQHYSLGILLILLLVISSLGTACQQQAFIAKLPAYLPPLYYQSIEVTPEAIVKYYFDPYGHGWEAEMIYDDQPFVFKNIEFIKGMMESKGPDYIWVDRIRCYAIDPGDVAQLKIGQMVDVVGMMRGISKDPDMPISLVMTECYFLPAGSLAIPVGGGGGFVAGY